MNNMYIRTKDSVYRLVDTYYMCVDGVETYMYDNNGRGVEIMGSQILKQSENLDDLCDGFYIDEGNEFSFYKENAYEDFEEAKEVFKKEFDDTSTLYGFIKTRKGLIYVAKMDSDPVLKLF